MDFSNSMTTANISDDDYFNTTLAPVDDRVQLSVNDKLTKAIYLAIGSVGIVGNGLTLLVLLSFSNKTKRWTIMLIINQTILDLFTSCILLLQYALPLYDRVFDTVADSFYCKIWLARRLLFMGIHSSTYNLVALTIERYISVVYPIKHKNSFKLIHVVLMIVATWFFGFLFDVCWGSAATMISNGKCLLFIWNGNAAAKMSYGIMTVIISFFIPLSILIFSYVRMIRSLNNSVNASSNTGESVHVPNKAKRNIFRTLLVVSGAFVLCVSWNQIWFFFFSCKLFGPSAMNTAFYHFTVVALQMNCCVNPFIYTANYREFQKSLRKFFPFCFKSSTGTEIGNSSIEHTTGTTEY